MNRRVQRTIWQINFGAAMISPDAIESLLFVHVEPLSWIRCLGRVVTTDVAPAKQACRATNKVTDLGWNCMFDVCILVIKVRHLVRKFLRGDAICCTARYVSGDERKGLIRIGR